ncbi:hypothetical protein AB0I55_18670 [Actinocatenispora sera]|jgi:hypothetical protein|uniref:hypothetical protein n=1 Tax=Actinocatenispora sera TaxID=390989 RepID=UPI0012ED26F0|nr:hypothetical protein [Actinocatenispora sera]
MSQEARDERLGLTGLSPERRRQRLDELERRLRLAQRDAQARLQARRADPDRG